MGLNPLISSINSGEFSARMEARVDFARYPNAAKLCRNVLLYPQGGFTRRPGTRFVKEVKDSTSLTKLVPFEFSEIDAYILEAGANYFRFFRRQGNLTVATTNAVIANGTFAAGIASWTNKSTGSAAIAHDATGLRMQLTGASDGIAWAEQSIAVSAANKDSVHVLRFTADFFGAGTVGFRVGTATGLADILPEVSLGSGYHAIEFTPGATTFFVQFRNSMTPVRNAWIDNISFLTNQALELVTPYGTSDLEGIRYYQAADVVYICNGDFHPMRLERRGHRSWSLIKVPFVDGPYGEINGGVDLTTVQLLPNSLFDNGIVGWSTQSTGNGFIAYNEAGKFVELDPGTSAGSGNAILRSTLTTSVVSQKHVAHILVLAAGPVTVKIGRTAGGVDYINTTQQPGWTSYEFTTSTNGNISVDFSYVQYNLGRSGIGGVQIYNENARLLKPSATTGVVTVTAQGTYAPFTANDVGRMLRLEWPGQDIGYGIITAFTSSTVVSMLVLRTLPSTVPTESWRFGAWSAGNGYPHVVTFYDGRSAFANTEFQPNTLWFSQSGQLDNMRPDSFVEGDVTTEDDDAITQTLRSNKINPIFWASGLRQLMVGTAGGQWVVKSSGAVVTPSDISAKQHSSVPCADLRAVEINQIVLFAERSRRSINDLGYSLQDDSFISTDLNILSDHILLRNRLEEMVYQRSPFSIVWSRKADGRLATLNYNKQHEVLGWAQSIIGGSYTDEDDEVGDAVVESIAVIPGSDDDDQQYASDERNELWMIVKRTINGSTKRYIEFLEYTFNGPLREDYDTELEWRAAIREDQKDAFCVDCGLTYDGAATAVVSGLDHLEGEIVKSVADGIVQPDKTVSSGSISFNSPASKIQVGLPYKHRYESLKIAASDGQGTSMNKVKIITSVGVVVLDTSEFKVASVDYDDVEGRKQHSLKTIGFKNDNDDPDDALPLFTGEKNVDTDGNYSRDARIYLESETPLPFTLLALAPQIETRQT